MSMPNAYVYRNENKERNGLNEIEGTYDELSTYYSDAYLDQVPKVPREISWNKNFADLNMISSPSQMMKGITKYIPNTIDKSPRRSSFQQINDMSNDQNPLKSKISQKLHDNDQRKNEMTPLCCCKNLYNRHPTLTLLLILGVFTCLVVGAAFIGILSINFVNNNAELTNSQKETSLTEVDLDSGSTNIWTFSTYYPTPMPSRKPTTEPSSTFTLSPSQNPSFHPTSKPTSYPSVKPSIEPSNNPSHSPSNFPSLKPSVLPSIEPSSFHSLMPTTSLIPTITPTFIPSTVPTTPPTNNPTFIPTNFPTSSPSLHPTFNPTTSSPSFNPTEFPTIDFKFSLLLIRPTFEPSPRPTNIHSENPTLHHSSKPSKLPSQIPSPLPSKFLSLSPSNTASLNPTLNPSNLHSDSPTLQLSSLPTSLPSFEPTNIPSVKPTTTPSYSPSITSSPTTKLPTLLPSPVPSSRPTTLLSKFQNQIPPMQIVKDMLEFSSFHKDTNFQSYDIQSHFHTTTSSDTEVHVLSHETRGYLVVAFHVAESNFNRVPWYLRSIRNNLDDFGPSTYKIGNAGKVDSRLNSEAFDNNLFKEIREIVQIVAFTNPNLRIFFTGHGRAGAIATLLGSFMAARSKDLEITILSSGSPKIGYDEFQTWVMRKPNLAIWRIVHKNDYIARLPDGERSHFGHLIQLNHNGASAYYQQNGDCTLNYAGVPENWEDGRSLDDHVFDLYEEYFRLRVGLPSITYYMTSFERGCGA